MLWPVDTKCEVVCGSEMQQDTLLRLLVLDPTDVYAIHIVTREWNCKSQMGYLLAENEGDRDMEEAFQNLAPVPSQMIQCLL